MRWQGYPDEDAIIVNVVHIAFAQSCEDLCLIPGIHTFCHGAAKKGRLYQEPDQG